MKEKLALVIGLLCCFCFTNTVFAATNDGIQHNTAQVYKAEKMLPMDENNVAKGRGTVHGAMAFLKSNANSEDAVKEIGTKTLNRGDYIGIHSHENDEEVFVIISGTGLFSNGKTETIVSKGDVTIARAGQSHGLRNIGYDPLVFISLIAQGTNDSLLAEDNLYYQPEDNNKELAYAKPMNIKDADRIVADKKQQEKEQRKLLEEKKKQELAEKKRLEQQEKERIKQEKERAKQEEERIKQEKKNNKGKPEVSHPNKVVTPANAIDSSKKRNDKQNDKNNNKADNNREAQLNAARAEEAIWEARQKEKVKSENFSDMNNLFSID